MTRDEIRALALECGFSLRDQEDGSKDLNEYVFAFALAIEARARRLPTALGEAKLRQLETAGWKIARVVVQRDRGLGCSEAIVDMYGRVLWSE
jgi:hypothetical protein